MQSMETIQALAVVDRDLIFQRTVDFFHGYAVQDVEQCLRHLDPNCTYIFPGEREARPFYGTHRGIEAIRKVTIEIFIEWELIWQDLSEILIDRDRSVVHRLSHIRHRGTGREATMQICDWLRFRDGLITDVMCISDVAPMVEMAL